MMYSGVIEPTFKASCEIAMLRGNKPSLTCEVIKPTFKASCEIAMLGGNRPGLTCEG